MNLEQSNIQPAVGQPAAGAAEPARIRSRGAAWLAWSLLGLGLVLLVLMQALVVINDDLDGGVVVYLISFNAFMLIGALIAARRPGNPIGWMFCAIGLTTNLSFVLVEYARLALVTQTGSLDSQVRTERSEIRYSQPPDGWSMSTEV